MHRQMIGWLRLERLGWLLRMPFSKRQSRLSKERPALSEAAFVGAIVAAGGDERAAEWVWAYLEEWGYETGFTPYPSDDFARVFGILEEELDEDLVLRVLTELQVPVPSRAFVERFGTVDSPLRLARLVAECRREVAGGPGGADRQ